MEAHLLTKVRDSALACHLQAAAIFGESNESTDEAIHTLRVQTKRLRAYWELLYPFVGKSQVKSATKGLRYASSSFGAARDHHVMVKLLGKLVAKAKKPKLQSSIAEALKVIAQTQATAPQTTVSDSIVAGDDVSKAWQRDRRSWENLDASPGSDSSTGRYVRTGLKRLFKKARDLHERAVTEQDIERWHDLRKWVKYLSLTVPLCGDDPATTVAAEEWARLGKSLGKLHDYDELAKRLQQLTPDQIDTQQAARIIRWVIEKRDRLCVQCDMLARRLMVQRPGRFAKTLVPD